MSTPFSPDGSEPLGRRLARGRIRPPSVSVPSFYQLDTVSTFLKGCEGSVALQLGDSMLGDGCSIVSELTRTCPLCQFCIIADSTFGEGDVDEVGAMHLDNQKIIHFGNANCKQKTTIDSLFIRVMPFSIDKFREPLRDLIEKEGGSDLILLSENSALLGCLDEFSVPTKLLHLNDFDEAGAQETDGSVIYIGEKNSPKLIAWTLQNQPSDLFVISPMTGKVDHNPVDLGRMLMQRFHMIERGKDAERVGLLIGSNGAHDLTLHCITKLRDLSIRCGKSCYVIVVGEPTPQKLANFPEMDLFVLIGSPEMSLLPAKGFYKPVVHPWEYMMACSGKEWNGTFCVNWALFLQDKIKITLKENDVSLITGKIRTTNIVNAAGDDEPAGGGTAGPISIIGSREMSRIEAQPAREGKEYFGLTQSANSAPSEIIEGTTGIAAGYNREKS